ncbi:MAG TPA: hypothetical protein VK810_03105 [Dongiaceae bacterium]|jgi:hypothetical protein|nr:hypothetical protein [Dongiaceae bacterium]
MKKIGLPVNTQFQIAANASVNVNEALDLTRQARSNRHVILESAMTIERELSGIISYYFLGAVHEKKTIFDEMILNSDWCSFAAKRKLIKYIINEQNVFESSEKNIFEKLFQRIMSFRNAFAHGEISSDGKIVWLSYFEGTPKKQEISDEYLTEIEKYFDRAYKCCFIIKYKIGIYKSDERTQSRFMDALDSLRSDC